MIPGVDAMDATAITFGVRGVDNVLVRRMLDLIDGHYADFVTLRTLSTSVGRQPAYLGRLFRQEVGSSFHDYLTQVRMQHAAELIRDGVKIEAVALCVGYRSKKNFYQQFRKQYATNPVPYRCRCVAPAQPDGQASLAGEGTQRDRPDQGRRFGSRLPRHPPQSSD